MNEEYRSYALSALLIAAIFAAAFAPAVPAAWKPYADALVVALNGTAALFHKVIPTAAPPP
jgi:hypothetical protein